MEGKQIRRDATAVGCALVNSGEMVVVAMDYLLSLVRARRPAMGIGSQVGRLLSSYINS
jgi:hypothetical protein